MFGQLTPAVIGLPVLKKNLYKPSERIGFYDILGSPTQIRCHEVAILLFSLIFEGNDETLLTMGANMEPRTADAPSTSPLMPSKVGTRDEGDRQKKNIRCRCDRKLMLLENRRTGRHSTGQWK